MRHHLVLIPFPAQGHLTSVLNLAKLLHSRGFYITFVLTEFTRRRLVRSRGPESVAGLEDFRFETVPDGLPAPSDEDATQDIPSLCLSLLQNRFLGPFLALLRRLGDADTDTDGVPGVTGIVADGSMFFALDAAAEMGVPVMLFYTISACGFLGYLNYPQLVQRGYTPLKDESCLTNGYLDTPIDWIPGMADVRLRDLPSFLRTTDPDDVMLRVMLMRAECARRADSVILNTFEDLERDVLSSIRSALGLPSLYAIGPLSPVARRASSPSPMIGSNLLEEDARCAEWLDRQAEGSVVYVNYGSIAVLTPRQLEEFARGLVGSGHPFLWVVRHDLVSSGGGKSAWELVEAAGTTSMMVARWCNQEEVLGHRAVGGFLTHCGWNSTLESVYEGVPMVCWPFFAEQPTNCRYACRHWGVGADMAGGEVRRERVGEAVREVMGKGKGAEMRRRASEWKEKARRAIGPGGTSYGDIERLVHDLAANAMKKKKKKKKDEVV